MPAQAIRNTRPHPVCEEKARALGLGLIVVADVGAWAHSTQVKRGGAIPSACVGIGAGVQESPHALDVTRREGKEARTVQSGGFEQECIVHLVGTVDVRAAAEERLAPSDRGHHKGLQAPRCPARDARTPVNRKCWQGEEGSFGPNLWQPAGCQSSQPRRHVRRGAVQWRVGVRRHLRRERTHGWVTMRPREPTAAVDPTP
eukprot:scaffold4240_cov27-Tisochrysis_lutea.AAC.2